MKIYYVSSRLEFLFICSNVGKIELMCRDIVVVVFLLYHLVCCLGLGALSWVSFLTQLS